MERIRAVCPSRTFRNPVVTLGNFDGVHLGHQRIFRQLIERATALDGESVVYTFEPHPIKILHPDKRVPLITTYEERADLVESIGVDVLLSAPFDRDFSQQSARDFVVNVLHRGIGVREVLVGYNYAFGRGREGNTEFLREMGDELGFRVDIIPPVMLDGMAVSSSRVRGVVRKGDVGMAGQMLGRPFSLEGVVQEGHRRGKLLGYPTANMALENELVPKPGVYAVRVLAPEHPFILGGMANLGTNPTFGDAAMSFEVHVFDFDADLYGKRLRVKFVERLRDEKKFASADALVEQLRQDEEASRSILQRPPT